MTVYDFVVAGGGAAGFFAAIACAERRAGAKVLILEKAAAVLGKVKISGGGRCNVTHACPDPRELVKFYPRGGKSLIGPFHQFGPADTMAWFEERGVALKAEADGRVFPVSDSSQTIIDCLLAAARRAGIEVRTGVTLHTARKREEGGFALELATGERLETGSLLLALGGTRNGAGAQLAASFGHRLQAAAPSLFTFNITHPLLEGLAGISVPQARVAVPAAKLEASGPLLITHWGLSGPAVLKLSARGARVLQQCDYRFAVMVNWTGQSREALAAALAGVRAASPRKQPGANPALNLSARLWSRLVETAGVARETIWSQVKREELARLLDALCACRLEVSGKSTNKDEFVTCGGVELAEINFKTMESRLVPGLYFAGEILDIDGLTGGFNFQAAWTTGFLGGQAAAEKRAAA